MAVLETDIEYRLSVPSASAGDTNPQADPDSSLGGFMSTTELDHNTPLHNLFDVITGQQNAAEHVDYRCVFVTNTNDTDTLLDAVVWIEDEVAVGADIAIALDAAGVVAGDSGSAQAATIATEVDAPAGASFSAPTTKGAGLVVGDLEAGEAVAVWLRRTATNSDPVAADGVTIRIEGDTAA
jgi:hypothetical protein